jgi:exopolysaccharide biosynthesis polyprenyl glycosylphosphotransferase
VSRTRFIALSVFLDAILVFAGYVLALLLWLGGLPNYNYSAFLALSPFIVVAYLASAWAYGLYDPERSDTAWALVRSTVAAAFLGTVLTLAFAYLGGPLTRALPRPTPLIAFLLVTTLFVGWRLLFLRFGNVRWPEQRVLIVGTGTVSVELADELVRRAKWGWRVTGLIDASSEGDISGNGEIGGYPILGHASDIARLAHEHDANRVIVVSPVALRELVESLVLADDIRVRVDVVPELYEIFIGTVDAIIGDVPLMQITRSTVPRYYAAAKRVIDLVSSVLLFLITAPILLVAAIAIVLTDGFPITYSQERSGKNLKPFSVHKLRTMIKDAEKHSGAVLAEEDDPRVTRVGRFLRLTRIDELPQLLNIIKGEMSFIGPRPERPVFVEQFCEQIPGYRERFNVKPGVTGLAQVSGGYATTPERKLKYDLIYMYHQNLAMDAQIVAETLRVVLTGRGAR